jgi:hypothetical protein
MGLSFNVFWSFLKLTQHQQYLVLHWQQHFWKKYQLMNFSWMGVV